MDKSLDDIIKSKKGGPKPGANKKRPGRRVSSKATILGNSATPVGAAARAKAVNVSATPATTASGHPSEKIIVSNLPNDVNEPQIRDLFSTTVGPLKEVTLHYDSHGKSKGTATVIFSRRGDGQKAHTQYNNRLIDGKRPMKIEMIIAPPAPPTLKSRVAPAPAAKDAMEGVQATAQKPRGPRKGGRRNKKPTKKSAEEMDAEMEDYSKSATAPAAAATTAA